MRAWGALEPAERAQRGDPYWQVWRIEGPGTILHFKGYPHVHAYVQVVRDPARANLGESLGAISGGIEGERMRRVLEGAMRRATGEALAFHADEVPGRFCPGEITTGLAYSLDPYRNHVVVASIEGRAMSAALRERLAAGGVEVLPTQSYRVATTEYFAQESEIFGEPDAVETGDLCCATPWWRTCARAAWRTPPAELRLRSSRESDHAREQGTASRARASVMPAIRATSKISKPRPRRSRQPAQALAVPSQEDGDRQHRGGQREGEVVAADQQAGDRVDRHHAGRAGRDARREQRRRRGAAREPAHAARRQRADERERSRGADPEPEGEQESVASREPAPARSAGSASASRPSVTASSAPPLAKLAPERSPSSQATADEIES